MKWWSIALFVTCVLVVVHLAEFKDAAKKEKKDLKGKLKDKTKTNKGKRGMKVHRKDDKHLTLQLDGDGEDFMFEEADNERKRQGFKSKCVFVGKDPEDPTSFVVISTCKHTKGGVILTSSGAYSYSGGSGGAEQEGELSDMDLGRLMGANHAKEDVALLGQGDEYRRVWDLKSNQYRLEHIDEHHKRKPKKNRPSISIDDGASEQKSKKDKKRAKRADPITADKYLQITIFIDQHFWTAIKDSVPGTEEEAEESAREQIEFHLAVARLLYLRDSMVPKVHLGLENLVIWKTQPAALANVDSATHHYNTYLQMFMTLVAPDENGIDHASIWTTLYNKRYTTLGVAYGNGTCLGHAVSVMMADVMGARTYLHEGYTFAHELGHNLGMPHDSGACDQYFVMTAYDNGTAVVDWSSCSRTTFQAHLSNLNYWDSNCLEDTFTPEPTGTTAAPATNLPSREAICRKNLGDCYRHAFNAYDASSDICHVAYCTDNNNFETGLGLTSTGSTFLEGTYCAPGKSCQDGACLSSSTPTVDGGWSPFGELSTSPPTYSGYCPATDACPATSTCEFDGQKLLNSQLRICNNPSPVGGGLTCPGLNSRSKVCHECVNTGQSQDDLLSLRCQDVLGDSGFTEPPIAAAVVSCSSYKCSYDSGYYIISNHPLPGGATCENGGLCIDGQCVAPCANDNSVFVLDQADCA